MLKPFYQGKLDTFCAIYAVINGFRLSNGIRISKGRDILNQALLKLSVSPKRLYEVLYQQTDYIYLVDELLCSYEDEFKVDVSKPFLDEEKIEFSFFWKKIADFLPLIKGVVSGNSAIFQFYKYIDIYKEPVNKHWTTVDFVDDNIMHLFDSSHDAEAIQNIKRDSFTINIKDISNDKLIYINPLSVRFLKIR